LNASSKRSWSLPFPVQPCTTASAPRSSATEATASAITGRDSAEISGYFPSYSAFAFSARATTSSANSALRSRRMTSFAPAARPRANAGAKSVACPTSTSTATTSSKP
jgi:hypothetical protein